MVPEQDPGGGSLRLCMAWDGTALDVTDVGACRGWDKDMTAAVRACVGTGNGRAACATRIQWLCCLAAWRRPTMCLLDACPCL